MKYNASYCLQLPISYTYYGLPFVVTKVMVTICFSSPSVFCPTIACYTPQCHGAEELKQAHLTEILKAAFILGIYSDIQG